MRKSIRIIFILFLSLFLFLNLMAIIMSFEEIINLFSSRQNRELNLETLFLMIIILGPLLWFNALNINLTLYQGAIKKETKKLEDNLVLDNHNSAKTSYNLSVIFYALWNLVFIFSILRIIYVETIARYGAYDVPYISFLLLFLVLFLVLFLMMLIDSFFILRKSVTNA